MSKKACLCSTSMFCKRQYQIGILIRQQNDKHTQSMIEDHYKTYILPASLNLQTADGSHMSSMAKATHHLQIADFKFLHTFVICDKLPNADFHFWHRPTKTIFFILL